jgi:two-component system, chemotaxis family, protein-glutamate methylesterase/glutaminase
MTMKQIKLLVVDDSLLMQKILEDIFKSDPQISVVGTARDGEEALTKITSLHPDVVTMDIEMPRMDGLTAVQKIMETNPLPIVMISTLTQREAQITLKALEYGAVDYVPKPTVQVSLNLTLIREELISKIKTAALANVSIIKSMVHENFIVPFKYSDKVISITSSTGGPPAVSKILRAFPADVPPILITQHMPKGITKLFADGLNRECKFRVKEAEEGDAVQERLALIAPGGFHMVVNKAQKINLTVDPPVNYVRPSGDVMMASLAEVYGCKNVGVVLTGMGSDGAQGIRAIKEKGGFTIAQDEKSCVVFGMPKVAFETGCVDIVSPLEKIPKEIMKACT